ncbi:Choline dehydrogenase [Curtobacterium sp. UNCCL20]|uniref:GMC oxidoreductase n=1 Tax=Curtobacterium sp. UNCCL20 TaxID=1502773 RepID=UPI00087EA5B1|nr:GMC oxidoreductase [Curtobacterium sp. UNCCL20]SDQ12993.1 Choline dehydrogenase [Curtobacterium sp. UNCCL20]
MTERAVTAQHAFVLANDGRLRTLVDRVVPADDHPSAAEAGALDFLTTALHERPDWLDRLQTLVDADDADLDDDHPDWTWFAELASAGYYADAANGGNAGERSWEMVGWQPGPPDGWSVAVPVPTAPPTVVHPADLAPRYDAVVIGSGAGGGVAACGLAESGRRVLVVEAGQWPGTAELSRDHIRNPRSSWGLAARSGPADDGHPRTVSEGRERLLLRPSSPGWHSNAATAGGGTRVYGAQAWRFGPRDFTMASTYGVPAGSSLADWPFGYDELERWYERAEWEVGVSGGDTDGPWSGPRNRPFPMPPVRSGAARQRLADAAGVLGISTVHVPLLVNSTPYLGRRACEQCGMCVGFACPVDAKNGSQNTMLTRAFATGNASILLGSRVARLRTDSSGKVVGVTIVGTVDGADWRTEIDAAEVVLAAGAVESARLLLNSRSDQEPDGIGNGTDQVGRHLQGHVYGGAMGVFDDVVDDGLGPGPSIATTDFRHGVDGQVGGGILANEFIATPSNTYQYLVGAGLIPRSGLTSKHGMRDLARRSMRIMGPIQEVTTADARVRVDPSVTDRYGTPVAWFSGGVHPEDVRARDHTSARSADWLRAAGATRVAELRGPVHGTSGGQHQAGTLRMGTDPATSVVDPSGRVWGHDELRVADGSVHVTNAGVNPVLTIFATAMRTIDAMVRAG